MFFLETSFNLLNLHTPVEIKKPKRIIIPSPLGLTLVFGVVVGEAVQDEDLAPLSALVERRQELIDVLGIQVQKVAVGVRLADLRQSSNCISHNL